MSNLIYRGPTTPTTGPAATTTLTTALTIDEVNQNFFGLNVDVQSRVLRSGDTFSGNVGVTAVGGGNITLATSGDITAYRAGGTTGVIYLASTGNKYLYNNGTSYVLPTQGLQVGGDVTALGVSLTNAVTVANGGTGVKSISGILYGNGVSPFTSATGAQIALAIGGATVQNATSAGTATNLAGGAQGTVVYQGTAGSTGYVASNISTGKMFLSQTGNGTAAAAPIWSLLANGDVPATLTGKTYNGLSLTANATGFSAAGGTASKTLTVNNTITLQGTDGNVVTFPAGNVSVARTNAANTFAGNQTIGNAAGNAHTVNGTLTVTGVINANNATSISAKKIDIASATLAASAPALTATQTWNNAAVKFEGMTVDVTNTASLASSTLLDLKVGGVSKFSVDVAGNVALSGDILIGGSKTTVNTATLDVADSNITLGAVGAPTDTTAVGGGLTLKGTTDKTITWINATNGWESSESVQLASGRTYRIAGLDVLSSNTLGAGIINSSLTKVGTIATGVWNATTIATGKGGTGLTTFGAANRAIYSTSASALTSGTLPVAAGGTGVTTSTGTGSVVLSASPTFTGTPVLGAASATSINGVSLSTAATGFVITGGTVSKSLTVGNSVTLLGQDNTQLTFQGTDTYVGRTTIDTLTNKTLSTGSTWQGNAIDNAYLANSSVTIGNTVVALGSTITSLTGMTNLDTSGGLSLNGTGSNVIDFNTAGVAPPSFTTRSLGAKVVLYPSISASLTDYAFGIDNSTLWSSVPNTTSAFKWYGGTTLAATLTGAGALSVSSLSGTSAALTSSVSAPYHYVTANAAYGLGFWGTAPATYGIRMSASGDATYGGRMSGETTSDYNMYFSMNGGTNRGFVFQTTTAAKLFSINNDGVRSVSRVTAPTFTSTIATGTEPFTVASTTPVANLHIGGDANSIRTILPVSLGGTGASATATALDNLLPAGGTNGQVLTFLGAGSYAWQNQTGTSTNIGTLINTSRLVYTATAAQKIFTCPTYTPGAGQLRVYIDGVRQIHTSYVETSATSVTLNTGATAGQIVYVEVDGYQSWTPTAVNIASTATGTVASTNVQAAIAELAAEKAQINQTMRIGTTAVAINRASAALTLAGVSLSSGSVGGVTPTAAAVGFTLQGGTTSKTLTVSNTLTLAGTDNSTLNIGTGGTLGTAAYADIALYAPIASPTLTGVPVAPTAALNTNTTQIATTAFVLGQAATAAPTMNAAAASVGVSTKFAREDHVHPDDTSKANTNQTFFIGTTSVAINRASAALTLNGVTLNGNASTSTAILRQDTRTVNNTPYAASGVEFHFKTNTTDGLVDGGTYHSTLDVSQWSGTSGGTAKQIGLTDNGNMWLRQSASATTWGAWYKMVRATSTTGGAEIPVGTTAQRDATPIRGQFRFNSTLNQFEGYNGTAWGAVGGGATGGVGNSAFYENDNTISQSYTIGTNKNAMTAGPVTINNGVTVTVPTGSTWTVV